MPNYPELRNNVREVRRRIKQDPNSPYRVRSRKTGLKDSRGNLVAAGPNDWNYRTMGNILTQPLSRTALKRLDQGLQNKKPRFVAVIPTESGVFKSRDEFVDNRDQIEYMEEWYEIQGVNNWDQLLHAHMVTVE